MKKTIVSLPTQVSTDLPYCTRLGRQAPDARLKDRPASYMLKYRLESGGTVGLIGPSPHESD